MSTETEQVIHDAGDALPDGWTPADEQAALDVSRAWLRNLPPGMMQGPETALVDATQVLDLARRAYDAGREDGQ